MQMQRPGNVSYRYDNYPASPQLDIGVGVGRLGQLISLFRTAYANVILRRDRR
jgi:hypothetical protein